MTLVLTIPTRMTGATMRDALVAGHRFTFGWEASPERIGVALAQLCEEHANGSAVWNFNLGNRDAGDGWTGDVFELTAREVIEGESVERTKRLRAYDNAAAGAQGYWLLLAEPRFAPALVAFDAGDPVAAAHALKVGRWYTGSETGYARNMAAIYLEVMREPTT